jgi:1-phosphatidylinositol-3-phosphate 5-kinase
MRFETSGGKSGSSFCKTSDDRFVFKAVQRVELNYFLENATAYFDYVAKSKFQDQPTALVKILGIYQISWEKGNGERRNPVSFIAMPNLFFRRRIAKTFDLKGSTRNRLADVKPGDSGTLLDANFLQFTNNFPILLTEASKEMLKVCVHNDTLWLSNHHLIDYSLLCGIEVLFIRFYLFL